MNSTTLRRSWVVLEEEVSGSALQELCRKSVTSRDALVTIDCTYYLVVMHLLLIASNSDAPCCAELLSLERFSVQICESRCRKSPTHTGVQDTDQTCQLQEMPTTNNNNKQHLNLHLHTHSLCVGASFDP